MPVGGFFINIFAITNNNQNNNLFIYVSKTYVNIQIYSRLSYNSITA